MTAIIILIFSVLGSAMGCWTSQGASPVLSASIMLSASSKSKRIVTDDGSRKPRGSAAMNEI